MKSNVWFGMVILIGLSLYGCSSFTVTPTNTESVEVQDQASLILALKASGASVEITDTVFQDFFSPEGSLIRVNGVDIQVFEYETIDAMESEASQVASDGGSVGTSMMMWMDTPHFFKSGRIILLYLGSDENMLNLLQKVIGTQFAGQ